MRGRRRVGPAALRVGLLLLGVVVGLALSGPHPSGVVGPGIPDLVAVAGLCWAGQLWYVGWVLSAEGAGTLRHWPLGPADAVTLLRGALFAIVAGFVVVPSGTPLSWVPALAYGTGVLLDYVDGLVARTVGTETRVGERLNISFDAFGVVAAPLVAVLWGQLPVCYLSLSAARYVYVWAIAWRHYNGRPLFDEPDSDLGRYLAAAQMVFLTAALVPVTPTDLVWTVAPLLLGASLSVFARDLLVVTGRLRAHHS
jgi:CDP-diacylglycerol--glycerol-3-phosphate 3-phosphatidyltransferase